MERKNIIAGSAAVFLFMLLGLVLEARLIDDGTMKYFWKLAHLHGISFGMLNVFYGLLIKNLELKGKIIFTGSILAVIGVIVFPAGLFLGGISFKLVYGAPLGGLSMIGAWAVMVYTVVVKK